MASDFVFCFLFSDYNKGCISNQKNPPSEEKLSSSNQEGGFCGGGTTPFFCGSAPAEIIFKGQTELFEVQLNFYEFSWTS